MKVAIVGRPNVGKSTLFNRLIGHRRAVEDQSPGTTRDRLSAPLQVGDNQEVTLVDTGGFQQQPEGEIEVKTQEQVEFAVEEASVILFVVSLEDGLTPEDRRIGKLLRTVSRPTLLVANKSDASGSDRNRYDFYELGFGEPVIVSALQRRGLGEVKNRIRDHLKKAEPVKSESDRRLAIVGRQNAGKSTFLNSLVASDRSIVSETPGTTRDLIDVKIRLDGTNWVVVDTPGSIREGQEESTAEMWSQERARRSIRRADVVLHLFDAALRATKVDKQLSAFVTNQKKPLVLVVNKWDLVPEDVDPADYSEYLYETLPGTRACPVAMISALNGVNIEQTIELAGELYEQSRNRVSNDRLMEVAREIIEENPPPAVREGQQFPELLSFVQRDVAPPKFICRVNDPSLFPREYRRYFRNQIREHLPFPEVPIDLKFLGPNEEEEA